MRRRFRPYLRTLESFESAASSLSAGTLDLALSPFEEIDNLPKPTIRTITAFVKLTEADFNEKSDYAFSSFPILGAKIDETVARLKELESKYKDEGYKVSSLRIATNPFGTWLLQNDGFVLAERLEFLGSLLQRHGIFGCCLGPAKNIKELVCVRQIIAASEKFYCFFVLDANDSPGAHAAQQVIYDISSLHPKGLANTRFCVAAKTCGPWNPSFPIAYYEGDREGASNGTSKQPYGQERQNCDNVEFRFAVGLENGQLVDHLLHLSGCIEKLDTIFRQGMIQTLIPIQKIADTFCSSSMDKVGDTNSIGRIKEIDDAFHDVMVHALFPPGLEHDCHSPNHNEPTSSRLITTKRFMGIDPTIDFPSKTGSFVQTLERLVDIDEFGDAETFEACDAVRKVLNRLEGIRTTGYCGISLPVCSDARFVELIESATSPHHLLTVATACTNGLDMVLVPGSNVYLHSQVMQRVQSVLLGVVDFAEKSGRPLICRILPVPGRTTGEVVHFKCSQYFVRCKVVDLEAC